MPTTTLDPRLFRPDQSEQPAELTTPQGLPANLDWDEYYDRFKNKHGEPVLFQNRIIFPDGWSYSSRSKAGPEYPPPLDWKELHRLLTCYWLKRLNVVKTEARQLIDAIQNLRALQQNHSEPLVYTYLVNEGGQRVKEVLEVNPDELEEGRLAWLKDDVANCESQLRELERVFTKYTLAEQIARQYN